MKIALSVVVALFLIGCGEDTKVAPKQVETKKVVEVKKAKEVVVEVEKPAQEVVDEKQSVVVEAKNNLDPAIVFKACSSCHGVHGEKAALGKSKVIKGWSAQQVTDALNGYKDGTYGGSMKGLMKTQANMLSPQKIEILSKYISTL
jgi:cytochrome c553